AFPEHRGDQHRAHRDHAMVGNVPHRGDRWRGGKAIDLVMVRMNHRHRAREPMIPQVDQNEIGEAFPVRGSAHDSHAARGEEGIDRGGCHEGRWWTPIAEVSPLFRPVYEVTM